MTTYIVFMLDLSWNSISFSLLFVLKVELDEKTPSTNIWKTSETWPMAMRENSRYFIKKNFNTSQILSQMYKQISLRIKLTETIKNLLYVEIMYQNNFNTLWTAFCIYYIRRFYFVQFFTIFIITLIGILLFILFWKIFLLVSELFLNNFMFDNL